MNRNLRRALLLSLALHGLILFGVTLPSAPIPRATISAPLAARLVEPKPLPPPPPPPAPQPERPRAQPAKPAASAKPAPAPPKTASAPKRAPEAHSAAPSPQPASPAAQPAPDAPVPPSVVQTEPQPPPASPSGEQMVVRTREEYRLQILDAARSHNRYPALARENNWEGQVLVYMTVGVDGRATLSVKSSSGHALLDRQALEMFRRAQAAVPLPPALRGVEFGFELRAIYNLKDQVPG